MKTVTSIKPPSEQHSFIRAPMPKTAHDSFSRLLAARQGPTDTHKSASATGTSQPTETSRDAHEIIFLGRLSKKNPTVSHLLIRNPKYRHHCWKIIYSEANRNKSFNSIPAGASVYIDPETKAITWERPGEKTHTEETANKLTEASTPDKDRESTTVPGLHCEPKSEEESPGLSTAMARRLVSALRAYIGTPYQKMDCYELLTSGLERIGVPYQGRDGIRSQLIQRAKQADLPANAYLNGEGLIDAAGTVLYRRSLGPTRHVDRQARQVWDDIRPILESGQILSFSTRNMGHTGIIARHDDKWTFINSGYMDHDLRLPTVGERVGEEDLEAEIRNWIEKAKRSRSSLKIKIGRLNGSKVTRFARHRSFHQRV